MTLDNLTIEEVTLIIEALLFHCSADIVSEHTENDMVDMLNLAVKIKRKTMARRDDLQISDKLQISSESNCDNLDKLRKIKTFFDLKEY